MSQKRDIKTLSEALAARSENFCRHFFPNGHKQGNYWHIGDTSGAAGRSLAIRLNHSGGRKAGNWTDYANSDEFGDLIDLLLAHRGGELKVVLDECRSFLGKTPKISSDQNTQSPAISANENIGRAQRIFRMGKPTYRTLASEYLLGRGIKRFGPALKFHPSVFIKPYDHSSVEQHPALLAKITNNEGAITGVARTFLDPKTKKLARFRNPKRVLGQLYGNAIRFGQGAYSEDLIAGEGLENVLSVGTALADYDLASCLTANHLGLFVPPKHIKRLWIARDNDHAGAQGAKRLRQRAEDMNIWVGDIVPQEGDFNDNLQSMGLEIFKQFVKAQIVHQA